MKINTSPPKKGQAAVEFALSFPIILIVIFGILDFSILFATWLSVDNVARQAVRYAATGRYESCTAAACTSSVESEKNAAIDAARLVSIKNAAKAAMGPLIRPAALAAFNDSGYYQIVVCSSEPWVLIPSKMGGRLKADYAQCQNPSGANDESPGEPKKLAIVMVDYNYEYVTPFINSAFQYFHLSSRAQLIVEAFRITRSISVPPKILVATYTLPPPTETFTPTITETPTLTMTPTLTRTLTLTPTRTLTKTLVPLYLDIIRPTTNQVITNISQTNFEAIAWDPNVGTSNGNGIQKVEFTFSGPSAISARTE